MEQQPHAQAPNPYNVLHDTPKPASIRVFGILNIVFGAMGLLCGGIGALFWFFATSIPEFADEFERSMNAQYAEGYDVLLLASSCFYFLLSVLQVACGMGLLKEKGWGRTGSVGYAVITILYYIAYTTGTIMLSKGSTVIISIAGAMCGMVIAFIYPVCILIFLTRQKVVETLKE
ncbi:MAG: hypothetical protein QF721_02935 [Verrucomicrobiota bacterium]|jgi:hypothetical protein|nr:hypothetical protein [Verrucomicrobiota bacterium]MDP7048385.1 hypothetical protein [Verrucomicrobiota bacterium]